MFYCFDPPAAEIISESGFVSYKMESRRKFMRGTLKKILKGIFLQ